jgi:carbonic anhydrase/acetyltransferase-like protein (isoleucine patch superfamily)
MSILPYKNIMPKLHDSVWVADNAVVAGDVEIGTDSSVWFGVQMRGDVHEIRIGARTNIQDNAVVHVTRNLSGTYIGDDVTVGHGAILHACRVENECLIGMGAIILDEAVIESGAMVAAGALVPPKKVVKSGQLWGGSPAKYMRDLKPEEAEFLKISADNYVRLAAEYKTGE